MPLAEKFQGHKMNFYKDPQWVTIPSFSGKTPLYQVDQQAGKRTSLVRNIGVRIATPSCRAQRYSAHFRAVGAAHVKRAGIQRKDGGRFQPRLHDLRHTFAVNRLLQWYQQGADVQKLLPQLSTYLGHRKLFHTQVYLSMTPELLQQAAARFASYVQKEEDRG